MTITIKSLVATAKSLTDGSIADNPEYTRGIVELIASFLPDYTGVAIQRVCSFMEFDPKEIGHDSYDLSKEPLDVWLQFESGADEEARAEANTFQVGSGYEVHWYLNAVGLVTRVAFDTLEEAHAWYEREGFQDFSS